MTKFYNFLIVIIFTLLWSPNAKASYCQQPPFEPIKMPEDWDQQERLRIANEDILLNEYPQYITKESKLLTLEPYLCTQESGCDPVRNCQMEKNVQQRGLKDVEYSIKTDSGIIIKKSHCSVIGKCIGYNDFIHSSTITSSEDRLIDIKENNALFYHYFYAANANNYEPAFNMTNFNTGRELYFNDIPHFSLDDKVIIEVRSNPKESSPKNFPTGFNINIYELNELGEYVNVEPDEVDPENPNIILSTFLSRNPECGETPYFDSWKDHRMVRLSASPPSDNNDSKKTILYYSKWSKKWRCKEDILVQSKCSLYFPSSAKYSSNVTQDHINNCRQ